MSVPICRIRLGGYAPHLSQITAGYALLHKRRRLKVQYDHTPLPQGLYSHARMLQAVFEDGTVLAYDLAEGYREIPDAALFDRQLERVTRYFKRSYVREFHNAMKNRHKMRPLGLNYFVTCDNNFFRAGPWETTAEDYLSHNSYPEYRAHFVARLYDPNAFPPGQREEIEGINALRTESMRACKDALGDRLFCGLLPSDTAHWQAPGLVLPPEHASRAACLLRLRENVVCVATEEPQGALGWDIAEFTAAGRAMLITPPKTVLPGEFVRGKNYGEFSSSAQCVQQLLCMLDNTSWLHRMEAANFGYHCRYVRPDALVLHTLKDAGVL